MQSIEDLTKKLLECKDPVSILECRSGWRVFVRSKWDDNGEGVGENLAYSDQEGGFVQMLEKAVKGKHKINEELIRVSDIMSI